MAINPLQAPINYSAQMVDLGPAFAGAGQAFQSLGESYKAQAKEAEAKAAKQQFAIDLQTATTDGSQKAWLGMIAKYPQFREAFGDVRKGVGEERLKNEFTQGFEISNAMEAKNFPAAIERTQNLIAAKKNSGEPTKIYEDVLSALEKGDFAAAQSGANLSLAVLDPDRYEKSVKARTTATKAPFELTEAEQKSKQAKSEAEIKAVESKFAERLQQAGLTEKNWNVKNLQSQIGDRSARLNLDRETTAATVAEKLSSIQKNLNEIPADTRKLINESATLAATSKQSANQMNDLAKRIEGLGGYGAAARLGEFAKSTLGVEGYETSLRQEYTRLRNQAAIKSLPPGPATDKDIELALRGFPKETSDSKLVASFLRGMAKLQDIDSAVSNSKTDWLANNNGALTRAKSSFIAGDYTAKPGENFNDFANRVVEDVSKRYSPATQSPLVEQIPTDRTPRPAAPAANIRSQADAILSGGR